MQLLVVGATAVGWSALKKKRLQVDIVERCTQRCRITGGVRDHLPLSEHLSPVECPIGARVVTHSDGKHHEPSLHQIVAVGIRQLPLLEGTCCRCTTRRDVFPVCTDALCPCTVPGAPPIQRGVGEVIAVCHVLRVTPCCSPQSTLKFHGHGIRRVVVAFGARVALFPQLVGKDEVFPLHWQDLGCIDRWWCLRHWRRRRRWWRGCTVAPVLPLAIRVPDETPVSTRVAVWVAAVVLASSFRESRHDPGLPAVAPLQSHRRREGSY
mmetsp:Transcript_43430/g.87551  ORF Transcript_43430/g.87551 Transcript_43430/m.87551 type:complete len:266 (+) Transcript_43430:271-1068(+)